MTDAAPTTDRTTRLARRGNLLGYVQSCPACQHEFLVPSSKLGCQTHCPHCHKGITVAATQPKADQLIGQTVAGYKLTARLGSGSYAVVYEGIGPGQTGTRVALKLMSDKTAARPTVLERFKREAELCRQLADPGVVAVLGSGYERGVHYQVLELLPGGSLLAQVQQRGPIPWRQAFVAIRPVVQALGRLHAAGVLHRDLKPANLLCDAQGVAKIADLGLAKQLDAESVDAITGLTMQGVPLGSPAYMAPEQVRSARDATAQSDIYGVGATLYHLLCGNMPFEGLTAYVVMGKVLSEDPPKLTELVRNLPFPVAGFVQRLMAKAPSQRPASCAEVLRELDALLSLGDATLRAATIAAIGDATPAGVPATPTGDFGGKAASDTTRAERRKSAGESDGPQAKHRRTTPHPAVKPGTGPLQRKPPTPTHLSPTPPRAGKHIAPAPSAQSDGLSSIEPGFWEQHWWIAVAVAVVLVGVLVLVKVMAG